MARLNFYQYVVLKHGLNDEPTIILIPSGETLDKSEKLVASKLIRQIPESEIENLEQIEIIVRPF